MNQIRAIILSLVLLLNVAAWSANDRGLILSDDAIVSLLTCTPGEPSYLHYGHAALRIQDPHAYTDEGMRRPLDIVFNYGLFSFSTEHFYYKFLRGHTDYMLGVERYDTFIHESTYYGRQVFEQQLNLDSIQRQQVMDALWLNYRPENRTYRYNFVFDNCASRPWHILYNTLGDQLDTHTLSEPFGMTYRQNIAYYSGRFTWLRFGINLVFGRDANRQMNREQALFLPENLMNYVEEAKLSNGESLCIHSDIMPFIPKDGTFGTSPSFVVLLLILMLIFTHYLELRIHQVLWPIHALLYLTYAVVGIIITLLLCLSEHPFVDSNWLILILNPLWLIMFAFSVFQQGHVWIRQINQRLTIYLLVASLLVIMIQGVHAILALVLAHTAIQTWTLTYFSKDDIGPYQATDRKHRSKKNNIGKIAFLGASLLLPCTLHAQKLTVIAIIDGLNSDNLQELRPYWQQGGLRMLSEEAYQTNITFPHLIYGGDEAVATLMTGVTPAKHGIPANTYYKRSDRSVYSILEDKEQKGIGCNLRISPKAILSPTLTDRFRMREGSNARIYAIGLNAETTVLMAGHSANACCWLSESDAPRWATTSYYPQGLPSAADRMNISSHMQEMLQKTWTPRMGMGEYLHPTKQEKSKSFSYPVSKDLLHTPIANTMIIELALALQEQEKLGRGVGRDMLLLQLNVQSPKAMSDRIHSAEQEDMYLCLNQDLGYLIEQLNKRIGSEYELLVIGRPRQGISADMLQASGMTLQRFNVDRAAALINTYLMALYGHERWVDGGYMNSIYLNRTLIEQKKLSLANVQRQVAGLLLEFEGIEGAYPQSDIPLLQGETGSLIRESSNKRTSGDVVFILQPCWMLCANDKDILDHVIDPNPVAPLLYWSRAPHSFPDGEHTALDLWQLLGL